MESGSHQTESSAVQSAAFHAPRGMAENPRDCAQFIDRLGRGEQVPAHRAPEFSKAYPRPLPSFFAPRPNNLPRCARVQAFRPQRGCAS